MDLRPRGTPEPLPRHDPFSRLSERMVGRTRTLHPMRGGPMVAISLVAGAGLLSFIVWALRAVTRTPAAPNVGVVALVIGGPMDSWSPSSPG